MPINESSLTVAIQPTNLCGEMRFHWQDVDALIEIDADGNGHLCVAEFHQWKEGLSALAEALYHIEIPDATIRFDTERVDYDLESGLLCFEVRASIPSLADLAALDLEFTGLHEFPAEHRHALRVLDSDGKLLVNDVLWVPQDPQLGRPSAWSENSAVIPASSVGSLPDAKGNLPLLFAVLIGVMLVAWWFKSR